MGTAGVVAKRNPADVLVGFFWLCHPGPIVFNGIAVTVFALLASWGDIHWKILALAVSAHIAMQLSIAILNDYCDRERDVLSKKNKPIVRGLVLPREALFTSLFMMLVMVVLLIPLNRGALLISVIYLALGQSYNLGLKTTPWGGVVFSLAIPLLPVYGFVAVNHFVPLVLWQMPVTAPLGLALHLANTLPDIEQDAANQLRNIAVVLGVRRSMIATSLLILLAAAVIMVLKITGLIPAQAWLLFPTWITAILSVAVLYVVFGSRTSHQARQTYFYFVVLTCLVLAGGWIASALIN